MNKGLKFKGKLLTEYKEEEKEHRKIIHEKHKPLFRELLEMIETNLPMFNHRSIQLLAALFGSSIKDLRQKISNLKWYASHLYFKEGTPQVDTDDFKSNPPLSYLYSKMSGQTFPLYRDIATMIEPVVQSELFTRGAVGRIYNNLTHTPYGYCSPADLEAIKDAREKFLKDEQKAKKHAEDEQARRDKKKLIPPTQAEYDKAGKDYLKLRERQKKESRARREAAETESIKKFKKEKEKEEQAAKDRRKKSDKSYGAADKKRG